METYVAGKVLLLAQDALVTIELGLKGRVESLDVCVIGGLAVPAAGACQQDCKPTRN